MLLVLVFTVSAAALKTGSLSVNGASVEISLEDVQRAARISLTWHLPRQNQAPRFLTELQL